MGVWLAGSFQSVASEWPCWRGDAALRGRSSVEISPPLRRAWVVRLPSAEKSSPVIAAGQVFIGGASNELVCLELATGRVRWRRPVRGTPDCAPRVWDHRVVWGTEEGELVVVSIDGGQVLWSTNLGARIATSPNAVGVSNAWRVVVGTYDSQVHGFDGETGQPVWSYMADGYVHSTPAVVSGRVVAGSCDGRVYMLDLADGRKLFAIEAGSYVAAPTVVEPPWVFAATHGGEVLAVDWSEGIVRWRRTHEQRAACLAGPALGEETLIVAFQDGRLWALKKADGQPVWTFTARAGIEGSPVVAGRWIWVGSEDGRLYAVELASGRAAWEVQLGGAIRGAPAVVPGWLVVSDSDGNVHAFCAALPQSPP